MITDEAPTPTVYLTETPMPTATPNYWTEVVTPAGDPARIGREPQITDVWIVALLCAILLSQWLIYFIGRIREERGNA